jgi:hypothetical protein
VLTSASSSSSGTTISGTLNSVASTTFRIEFFANQSPNASGYGEGKTFLVTLPWYCLAAQQRARVPKEVLTASKENPQK